MEQEYLDIALKLGSALAAGSVIGLERSYRGRPAGFRTHALVCVASAILMMMTAYQWQWLGDAPLETIRTDPTRMAQGIMTGIGFLGAGVIFREGMTVRGLTTAASIWITAAIGILYGVGFYYLAVSATVVTLGTLAVFRWFEDRMPNEFYAHHVLTYPRDRTPAEDEIRRLLQGHGFAVSKMSYRLDSGGAVFEYRTVIKTVDDKNLARLAESLRAQEDLLEFRISPIGD